MCKNIIIYAACRENEFAFEYKGKGGVFSNLVFNNRSHTKSSWYDDVLHYFPITLLWRVIEWIIEKK